MSVVVVRLAGLFLTCARVLYGISLDPRLEFTTVARAAAKEKKLRIADFEILPRMQWWAPARTPLPPSDRYLLFTFDDGGPNNIRIGWEMSGLVAKKTGRTLVLPPAAPMYLLDYGPGMNRRPGLLEETKTAAEDLINLDQLKANLPTMTVLEFEKKTGVKWDKAIQDADRLAHVDEDCKIAPYQALQGKFVFMDGKGSAREGFRCGKWWERGGPKPALHVKDAEWGLLTHGFLWHKDIFRVASKAVQYLGLFNYVALHARYNDFQFHESQQTPQAIVDSWSSVLQPGTLVYVASDEPRKFKDLHWPAGVRVIMWDDLLSDSAGNVLTKMQTTFDAERWFKLTGPIEELICTYAKVFIGSEKSSFSGHVHRMRLHAHAPTVTPFVYTRASEEIKNQILAEVETWQQNDKANTFRPLPETVGDMFFQISQVKN